ncbi:MAG: heparinase II/III-family protein [Pirellulales bacterium]|nr:heparinase II/III-family protein [Pirellulales bacterium]
MPERGNRIWSFCWRHCARPLRRAIWPALFLGLAPLPVAGQMKIPTAGVLPASMPTQSLLLGNQLAQLRADWSSPVNATQQLYINSVNSFANHTTSGAAPTTLAIAAADGATAENAGLRYAMTGSAADLNKAIAALTVAAIPNPGFLSDQNAFITRPERLMNYLMAYDFIRGAPLTDLPQATRTQIEGRLASLATSLDYGNGTDSNARAKIGGTVALAGVLLRDQALLDRGLVDLQRNLDYSTTDDGWYADGPSHYLNYTLRHFAAFARAYEQGSGVNLYGALQPFVELANAMRLPGGEVPNLADGLNLPVATGLFTNNPDPQQAGEALWYLNNIAAPNPYPWNNGTNVVNNDGSLATFFALTNFHVAPTAPGSPTYLADGQSHVSVLRDNFSPTSDYLLLSAGVDPPPLEITIPGDPSSIVVLPAFHSHADTGEILLASGGQYLLVAPGYNRTDLSQSPAGFAPQRADWHNVILVDGGVGVDPRNLAAMSEGMYMRPDDFVSTHRLDSGEFGGHHGVSDFSTLRMTYAETDVSRSIAYPHESYFVVADQMQGAASHDYGFNLVGVGTQTVLTNTPGLVEVQWEQGGQRVIQHLVATGGMSLSTDSLWMHDEFNQFVPTQRMTATMHATDGLFLSILETGTAGGPGQLAINNLSTSMLAAAEVLNAGAGWTDIILSQHHTQLALAGDLLSDGQYAYVRQTGGLVDSAMLAAGTRIDFAGHTLLSTTAALTMSAAFTADSVLGTISADEFTAGTELHLFGRTISSATLNGAPLAFLNGPEFDVVYLIGAGDLVVTYSPVPEPSTLALAVLGALSVAGMRERGRRRRVLLNRDARRWSNEGAPDPPKN